MQRLVMHLDMDAFFASVEQLDHPEWRGKPLAVGGSSDRSVVSAASYEIRSFGVRSAMPMFQAKRLCPHGLFVPGRMSRYAEVSRQVMAVLAEFSPLVEQASVDEAYLDASGLEGLFGPPETMGRLIKDRVFAAVSLTCSVGFAPVKFLAKIASDMNKPDGLTVIRREEVPAVLARLPIGRIPGVGQKSLPLFQSLGVVSAADVLRYSPEFWKDRLGAWGPVLYDRARGIDPSEVDPHGQSKSCSAEHTFEKDTLDKAFLRKWLLKQSDRVAAELRSTPARGRTVTLKVKFSDFKQITRRRTLDRPTSDTAEIHAAACALLDELALPLPVRLIGVGVGNFAQGPRQLALLGEEDAARKDHLEQAVDKVRQRFGKAVLKRGDVLDLEQGD